MALRGLLGSAKKIVHDPGPKGNSGEGDAALVMIFIVIAATILILIYGEQNNDTLLEQPIFFMFRSCASIPSSPLSRAPRSLNKARGARVHLSL
jgi:hypothetical protein